jgi:hypothetical protein
MRRSSGRRYVLEIYSTRTDAVTLVPLLRPYWTEQPPLAPGLPPQAWRFPLPPVPSIADQVGQAVQRLEPRRWLGFVARP